MRKRILILGAGLSGLAAAVHLIRRGFEIAIVEKRPYAGGRTFSFQKGFWPYPIDNGPHVMLGCYEALLELLGLVNGRGALTFQQQLQIPFLLPHNRTIFLKTAPLPSPLHLIAGFMRFPLFTVAQKCALFRTLLHLNRVQESPDLDKITVQEWLMNQCQDRWVQEVFWTPLVLATLNAHPGQVSFLQLFRVLKIGFLKSKNASRLIFISSGLSPGLIHPILHYLQDSGCRFHYRQAVKRIETAHNKVIRVATAQREFSHFDAVVSALPVPALLKIIRSSPIMNHPAFRSVSVFQANAILNFHFWHQGPCISVPFGAFLRMTSQWLFSYRAKGALSHYTVVVSGAKDYLETPKEEMVALIHSELQRVLPGFSSEKVRHYYLTVEKYATLLSMPGMEHLRPPAGAVLNNFYLAGDWTNTGLPATMESAVRSGRIVAEKIVASFK